VNAGKAGLNRFARCLARLRNDKSGAAAIIAGIIFPVAIGGMGLGAEVGYWYLKQRNLQNAADLSAHAAGVRKGAGDSEAEIETVALDVAMRAGLSSTAGTLTLNTPPTSGSLAGDGNSIEVIVAETQPRLFSSILTNEPLTLQARAVVQLTQKSKACILALSPTAPGAVTIAGSTELKLDGCDVASNSAAADSFLMDGSTAKISTGCVFVVGEAVTTTGLTLTECPNVKEYSPPIIDPYETVEEPIVTGSCNNKNVGSPGGTTTLTPSENHPSGVKSMRFCNGLDVKGKVVFQPGLYIIENGDFSINGGDLASPDIAELASQGVTFYLTGGSSLKLSGNAKLNLAAPTSGPFAGILFFGSRDGAGVSHEITGTSDSTMQGAVYAPASEVEFKGNSTTSNGCTQVIGWEVTFTGNSSLQSTCDSAGTKDIVIYTSKLVE
jgi:hypothetical protein